jgi:hypothetical protein
MSGVSKQSTEDLILHSDPAEFHERQFWDRFYASRDGEAFEWYGCWSDVEALVLAVASPSEPVLVLGCGKYAASKCLPFPTPLR